MFVFLLAIGFLYFVTCFLPQAFFGVLVSRYARRFHTDEAGFPTEI